jgi:hypothetical protein
MSEVAIFIWFHTVYYRSLKARFNLHYFKNKHGNKANETRHMGEENEDSKNITLEQEIKNKNQNWKALVFNTMLYK